MTAPQPHVRGAGEGSVIVCLHGSTSSSKQWQTFIDRLSADYRVIAPDLYGYGKSPEWSEQRPMSLDDEINLLKPMLDDICGSFHLIGHSYGAAVAFKLSLGCPSRIRSLVAYEPVLFNLLFQDEPDSLSAREICAVQKDVRRLVEAGQSDEAGRRFVDYWSGEGVWDKLPDWQREAVAKRMTKVVSDFDATMDNPTTLEDYRSLDIPTLFMYGAQSPESTRRIAEWLGAALPRAEVRGLLPLGHMGPVTHAEQVQRIIEGFIRKQPQGILTHQLRRSRG